MSLRRRNGLLVAAALLAASCQASATVEISEGVQATAVAETNSAPATPEPASQGTADALVPTVAALADPATGTDPECRYLGVDDFGDMQLDVRFVASLERQDDATVEYELFAGDERILQGGMFIEDARPGESFRLDVDTVEEPPRGVDEAAITCRIVGIEPIGFGSEPFRAGASDSCRFAELDAFDDIQIEIILANPAARPGDLAVDYALRGPDGVRFDDGVAFLEAVPTGQPSTHAVDTFSEYPDWVEPSAFSCEILAIETFG